MNNLNEIMNTLYPCTYDVELGEEESKKVIHKLIEQLQRYPDYMFRLEEEYFELPHKGELFYMFDMAILKRTLSYKQYASFFTALYDFLEWKIINNKGENAKLPSNIKYALLDVLNSVEV